MGRSRIAWGWALLAAIVLLGLTFLLPERQANASALSASSNGLLGTRRYLEARDVRVTLSDLPLEEAGSGRSVWVLAFPWQRPVSDEGLKAVQDHLRGGGTVLLAYSKTLEQHQEERVLERLGLDRRTLRDRPSLVPWKWLAYQRQAWILEPGEAWGSSDEVPELVLPAMRFVPRAPRGASVLYRFRLDGADVPVVFSYGLLGGHVVALPASVVSNAYLLEAGHADFLETLRGWLGEAWSFDEYHHGLVNAGVVAEKASTFAWDLFMIHLLFFYLLGLLAVARRFGPPWREAGVITGSTSAFLRNLGALHRELHHHQAAARLLARRLQELDTSLGELTVPEVRTDASLVEAARQMTRNSRRRTHD